jgi:hypothetical protein
MYWDIIRRGGKILDKGRKDEEITGISIAHKRNEK